MRRRPRPAPCRGWVARSLAGVLAGLLTGAPVSAATLLLCHEDRDAYPWTLADGAGLDQALLARVERVLPVRFAYVALPWRRCLDGLARGLYDGAFAASFDPERGRQAAFPLEGGVPDRAKRLHTAAYALYRRTGEGPHWDGERFLGLEGRIGSLSGFSIADFLRAQGAQVDETSRDPLALLLMLKNRRFQAAALQAPRGDRLLETRPELAGLEKAPTPLQVKDYYLVFSLRFARDQAEQARAIWEAVQREREALARRGKHQGALAL